MSRQGQGRTVFALALFIAFAGSGCGQKGPLFLPGTNTTGAVGAAAGSASAAAR